MTPQPDTASSRDGGYLRVTADSVDAGCEAHPAFTASLALDPDRRVPSTWLAGTLGSHLCDHHQVTRQRPEPEPQQELWLPATAPLAVA